MKKHETDIRLEKAFLPMPHEMKEEIEYAFERGEKAMKKRNKIISMLGAAALVSVFFAVVALAANELGTPQADNIVLSAGEKLMQEDAQATLVPLETETADSVHFYQGDFTDPDALYILLSNAYWNYARENNLDMDSRVVFAAAQELISIPDNFPEGTNRWASPVLETLRSVLGFDEDFIARHYLGNDVIACLAAEDENEPEPEELNGEIAYMASYPRLIENDICEGQ